MRKIKSFLFINTSVLLMFLFPLHMAAQGPNAPEAGGFEPIDATDMVNYLTGDFTYVLPLMNVPSPEGGYPISLAYHAGIATDQEASWTGLGWNLNPGVINRSVNGFPDDYKNTIIREHFYDEGGSEEVFTAGVSYSHASGVSVGLNFSWGTNKAFGGNVTYGFGIPLGKGGGELGINGSVGENNSIGVGLLPGESGGLSFGANINDKGTVGGSLGLQGADNSGGLKVSANSNGGVGFGVTSLGKSNRLGLNVNLSDSGIGIQGTVRKGSGNGSFRGLGTGINISFNNSIEQGDYTLNQSGWTIPIIIPLPEGGTLSAFFGKQKAEWYLNNTKSDRVSGGLYPNGLLSSQIRISCTRTEKDGNGGTRDVIIADNIEPNFTFSDAQEFKKLQEENQCFDLYNNGIEYCNKCVINIESKSNTDSYEFPLEQFSFVSGDQNNAFFPNFDSFNVSAQGISGSLSPSYFENGNLVSSERSFTEFDVHYKISSEEDYENALNTAFKGDPKFYLDNEFVSYLGTSPIVFNESDNYFDIFEYDELHDSDPLSRRKTSNFIEYFTNEEIRSSTSNKYTRGYIEPSQLSEVSPYSGSKGIGAFAITNSEGKTYHYSIPVYNHVTSTRNIGSTKDQNGKSKDEKDAYFERLQESPYATHWLLTAVTGPDYIDLNNNHRVDDGDYGYWVELDYGKWSEAFGWKTPYGEEYTLSKDDDDFKSQTKGFKEVWYLDAIKTRTHTAIFSKSLRTDNLSYKWVYNSIDWSKSRQNSNDFFTRFTLPEQRSLKLDKVILFKNEVVAGLTKSTGNLEDNTSRSLNITFLRSFAPTRSYTYNREDHVFDHTDISDNLMAHALKVVDLEYRHPAISLAKGTPNVLVDNELGRLTLSKVRFNGKGNSTVLPAYEFNYHNDRVFDVEKRNPWGYYEDKPWMWSLNEIQTPEGSKIRVGYESDDFHKPVLENGRLFTRALKFNLLTDPPKVIRADPISAPKGYVDIHISLDENDPVSEGIVLSDHFQAGSPFYMDLWHSAIFNQQGDDYTWRTLDIESDNAQVLRFNDDNSMIVRVLASGPFRRGDESEYYNISSVYPISFLSANNGYGNGTGVSDSVGVLTYTDRPNQKHPRYRLAWVSENNPLHKAYSLQFFIIGNKKVCKQIDGDLRVAEIEVTDGIVSTKTSYKYHQLGYDEDPNSPNYRSSGTVSYIPDVDNNPIPYASELPAPKVMYEYVTVEDIDNSNKKQGKSVYHFNVMKERSEDNLHFGDFLNIDVENNTFYNPVAEKEMNISSVVVNDNLSSIGQLLTMSTFNNQGHLLSKTTNKYYDMDNRPNDQGVDQQSYHSYKFIDYKEHIGKTDKWILNSSTRRNYVQALEKTTSTGGGQSITSFYNKYDDVSGNTVATTTISSDGTTFKSKIIPAYTMPVYSENNARPGGNTVGHIGGYGMGSKVDDITNKNMLSQEAANFVYKMDDQGNENIVSATIMTWNNDWSYRSINGTVSSLERRSRRIWRKKADFIWKGSLNEDGTYANYSGEYDNFDWSIGASEQAEQWQRVSETTLYDHYSMPLESVDINGNYASTKMDKKAEKIFSVANAGYTEQFYSGAEEGDQGPGGGEIRLSNPVTTYAHTGQYSEKAANGSQAYRCNVTPIFNDVQRSIATRDAIDLIEKYKISVWAHKSNYSNARIHDGNGGSSVQFNGEVVFAGDWVMLNHYVNMGDATTTIYLTSASGDVYFDDFRVHPIQSSMSSYVYNEWDELTHIIGANNMATRYEYDEAGRLKYTYIEVSNTPTVEGGFKMTQEYNQNYSRPLTSESAGN